MSYFAARNFRRDLGSAAVSSCHVSDCSRQRRTQLLTARITKYQFSIRSGRRASHKRRTIRRSHGRRARRESTGNDNIVFTKKIEYTDFPLDEIPLYFANNVILLPSEY